MPEIDWKRTGLAVLGICIVTAVVLFAMGRTAWCSCGSPVPWSFDTWSLHNSQHILDAYSFSHMLHGVMFFAVLYPLAKWIAPQWRIVLTGALEAAWEILENTPMIINKYRENTASLDYFGDSVANSMADILFCLSGALFTATVPVAVSAASFVLVEFVLIAWIKDSLLLNMLMLVYPLESIKNWQAG